MVLQRDDLRLFAQFLRQTFDIKPIISINEGDELLRAVVGTRMIIIMALSIQTADVWCSDKAWAGSMWEHWMAYAGKHHSASRA